MKKMSSLKKNTYSSLVNQAVTMVFGFILPILYLEYYGSEVNGLVSSITQFINFISFMELGVGAVVQSNLYKPLGEKKWSEVSKIVVSARRFFNRILIFFLIYILGLFLGYPRIVDSSFSTAYVAMLIIIMAFNAVCQYYFGVVCNLLLNADQKAYIPLGITTTGYLINTIIAVLLICKYQVSVHVVFGAMSVVYVTKPVLLYVYVKRKYSLNYKITYDGEPIKQKWNGLAQHIASVILSNTDTMVLTVFSTLTNVSVYSVYNLVVSGIKSVVLSLTNGYQALLGNQLAMKKNEQARETFGKFEFMIHSVTILFYSCTIVLIVPFVKLYTYNIHDAEYVQPLFALLISLAQTVYCLRLPYNVVVLSAGHYKQTQKSAIIEALLNLFISIILVYKLGLVGVAIGTLIAMCYRTGYLAHYITKNILFIKVTTFYKHIIVDICYMFISVIISSMINNAVCNYIEWIVLALKVFGCNIIILILFNLLFFKEFIWKRK